MPTNARESSHLDEELLVVRFHRRKQSIKVIWTARFVVWPILNGQRRSVALLRPHKSGIVETRNSSQNVTNLCDACERRTQSGFGCCRMRLTYMTQKMRFKSA